MIGIVPVDKQRNTLFSEAEKKEFITQECGLIAQAKQGEVPPLLIFWGGKRNMLKQRATERGIPLVKV